MNQLITSLIPLDWTPEQLRLAGVVKRKAFEEGDYSLEEVEAILTGLMIGGPLGIGCPSWKITAITGSIETGPGWTKELWGGTDCLNQREEKERASREEIWEETKRTHHVKLGGDESDGTREKKT